MLSKINSRDTGLPLESCIPDFKFNNWDNKVVSLRKETTVVFMFLSVFCNHCVDLMPHLDEMRKISNIPFILFCTGDDDDHAEMVNFFGWDFHIVSMPADDMEKKFNIQEIPFAMLYKVDRLFSKGVVYTKDDFLSLLKYEVWSESQ